MYRVLNGGVLVKALVDQGELDAAEEVLTPLHFEVESGFARRPQFFASPAAGCGWNRDESPMGLRTIWQLAIS